MPVPLPPGFAIGTLEPADAVAAFQRRDLLEPSFRWQDVWEDEHSRAFAVAGVSRLDILKSFRDELELAVREGRSLKDFRKAMRPRLQKEGWWGDVEVTDPASGETRTTRFDDRRLALIFDVNSRQSHAAGRWQRIERDQRRRPYVMYRTMRDERVRASHAPWDGVVLPVGHPWWNTHYPPNGWRCRCTAFSLSQRDLERRLAAGEKLKTEPPPMQLVTYVNPRTGEVTTVPRGIDPGFGYNPGKARDAALHEQMLRKSLQQSPLAGAAAVAQAQRDHAALVQQATEDFGRWVDQVLAARQARGAVKYVGVLQPGVVRELAELEVPSASAAVAVRDEDVLHALRPAKGDAAVPADLYRRLPELLARASAMLLERGDTPALLYVVDLLRDDGSVAKLVLQLDRTVKVDRMQVQANILRTATVMQPKALGDTTKYELVWGKL